PFILEAFVIPTNSMAPTLIGSHKNAVCPHCGGDLVVPYDPEWEAREVRGTDEVGICRTCMRTGKRRKTSHEVGAMDRIFCNKLLRPGRWELMVFRVAWDPKTIYVCRVVGLPGEQVVIKEGALWIDGKKMEPPED